MSDIKQVDSSIKGAVAWEDVLSETIKLASSSFGIIPGLIGIVAAPLVVSVAEATVEAFKSNSSSEPVKIIRKGPPPKAAATIRKAEDAAKANDAKAATELLQQAAAEGSPQALVTLGLSLVETDPNKAIELLKTAAKSGDEGAKLQLALLLVKRVHEFERMDRLSGDRFFAEYADNYRAWSNKLFEELCAKKNAWAMVVYAEELINDGKVDEAEEIFGRLGLSIKGFLGFTKLDTKIKARAGVLMCYLPTYEGNVKLQRKVLEIAVREGDTLGMNNLAMLIKDEDPARSRQLLERAAGAGLGQAVANLVELDSEELGISGIDLVDNYIDKILSDHLIVDFKKMFVACGIKPDSDDYQDFFDGRFKRWQTKGYDGTNENGKKDPFYRGGSFQSVVASSLRVAGRSKQVNWRIADCLGERIEALSSSANASGTSIKSMLFSKVGPNDPNPAGKPMRKGIR